MYRYDINITLTAFMTVNAHDEDQANELAAEEQRLTSQTKSSIKSKNTKHMTVRRQPMTRFDDVTRQIKAQLEAGTRPWIKPWNGGGMPLPQRCNGEFYQGINIILLWMMGRTAPTWMTYNQAKQLGGQVRRGEKGTGICYTAPVTTKEDETYHVYKWYTVFNAEQIDGLPPQYYPQPVQDFVNTDKRIVRADTLAASTGADIKHGEPRAYYVPAHDYINMPEFGEFRSALDYYSTMFHELVHWTGHKTRMDRKFSRNKTDYAIEELSLRSDRHS